MSLRVGVLGSTRGTALKGVLDAIAAGTLDVDLRIVISDKPTAPILDRAKLYKVPSLFVDPTGLTREQYDERVSDELRKARVELVLLIGYMRILSPHFVERLARPSAQRASLAAPGLRRPDESQGPRGRPLRRRAGDRMHHPPGHRRGRRAAPSFCRSAAPSCPVIPWTR